VNAFRFAVAPPGDAYLARRLAQPHVTVLVAQVAGALVGGLIREM
jgi:hypothetical protein